MKKAAFTMIELIFVIVILGILAAVAIPKLAATRDDARIAKNAHDIMATAFETSTYVLAKTHADDLPIMSRALKSLEDQGVATVTSSGVSSILYKDSGSIEDTASFSMGQQSDCIKLELRPQNGDTELMLKMTATSSSDRLCLQLQKLIDFSEFPMTIRGNSVVY